MMNFKQIVICFLVILAIKIEQVYSHYESGNEPETDRYKGITKFVPSGAITHCQTDTGQQCFQVYPEDEPFSVDNPFNLTIDCDPTDLCVFPFDTIQSNHTVFLTFHCLNWGQFKEGSNVTAIFGKQGFNETQQKPVYGSFFINGPNAYASWDSTFDSAHINESYFNQSSGTITTTTPADNLYIKCVSVENQFENVNSEC